MPVPVPHYSKSQAHTVAKQSRFDAEQKRLSVFHNLTCSLPVSPTGPPPSFGTREEWINSLPSWRRTKPRRIWEDDHRGAVGEYAAPHFRGGLTAAGNAPVIKGAHAQACFPPVSTSHAVSHGFDGDADDEMSPDYAQHDNQSNWSASSNEGRDIIMDVDRRSQYFTADPRSAYASGGDILGRTYEKGAFTPVFEDQSPGTASGHDDSYSPVGPITPFGEFVDRAVTDGHRYSPFDDAYPAVPNNYQDYSGASAHFEECQQTEQVQDAPSVTASYKKLADPLAEWVATYVWKACTTGMSLPSKFAHSNNATIKHYPRSPPAYLTGSVHSLLLSTLLQPSAVFLAVWYIVRLPVFFNAAPLSTDHVKEIRFRAELLGESHCGLDRDALENSAPFRLVLLGCMLANKWLDDHTFSNKTWHTISNVPVYSLNKLESLALDIFAHDLSIPRVAWSGWLAHLTSYHLSLSSPTHPQPIGRPSSNPHSIVKKAIEELVQAPLSCDQSHSCSTRTCTSPRSEPIFLGLEERKREKMEEQVESSEYIEIDLDEDGPLRDEYLPRRRGSVRSFNSKLSSDSVAYEESRQKHGPSDAERQLPPPAKWRPSADEPIVRERTRTSGHYVAVQPPVSNSLAPLLNPASSFYPMQESRFPNWASGGELVPIMRYDGVPIQQAQTTYSAHPLALPITHHSRTLSLSSNQEPPRIHHRSYSQLEYRGSSVRVPIKHSETQWPSEHYGYPAHYVHPFVPSVDMSYQSAWLRA